MAFAFNNYGTKGPLLTLPIENWHELSEQPMYLGTFYILHYNSSKLP